MSRRQKLRKVRKFLLWLLQKPLIWIANFFSQAPRREDVFRSLSQLYTSAEQPLFSRLLIVEKDVKDLRLIVFSDQHKGNKSFADDFASNEFNYLQALKYYYDEGFTFVGLGDCEELWKFPPQEVLDNHAASLTAEAAFMPDRLIKTFGNHDLLWKSQIDATFHLSKFFGLDLKIYEGALIKLSGLDRLLTIFLTHGHQGDSMSDGNRFSSWVIARIWMPLQRYLRLNVNVPSKDYTLRNRHNALMYEWCKSKDDLLLITGHTHKPVFASGRYYSAPGAEIVTEDENLKPAYFNSGCCCYADGDITGIEIADAEIRLVRWHHDEGASRRTVLERTPLSELMTDLIS